MLLLKFSRIPLLAALALFAFTAVPTVVSAQDDAATEQADTDAEQAADHDEGDHDDGDHKEGHDESDHDSDAKHAGDDGHGGHGEHKTPPLLSWDFGSAVCNLAIFLGVFAILSKFVWPVILGGLKAREDKIADDLESAEKANADAKQLLADYQAKVDDAAKQVQTMLADARKDSEAAGQRIVEEAKAEAERQRERAVADIETAKKVALSDLAGQTSDMAINVAKQVVGRELKAEDHAELIRKSLDQLPSNN